MTTAIDDPLDAVGTLTPRQREVLALAARGMTNPEIGERLGISKDGAKWHIGEVLARLDVDTREEAVDLWKRYNGLPYRLHRLARAVVPPGAMRWVVASAGAVAVVSVTVAAIKLSNGGPSESPAAASPVASNTVPAVTGTADTGVAFSSLPPLLQNITRAVEGGRETDAAAVLHPTPWPCTAPQTPGTTTRGLGGGPECPPGVAPGTSIGEYITVGDCEGGLVSPAAAAQLLLSIHGEHPTLAYWVRGRAGPQPTKLYDYLVFSVAKPTLRVSDARIIRVDGDGVVGINTGGCVTSALEAAHSVETTGGFVRPVRGGG